MTNICVIPARGGSQRIPRKNIKLFHGKPIIDYSIRAALDSGLFQWVYVSTEDDEISKVVDKYDSRVCVHPRSKALAQNSVGTLAVTGDVARKFSMNFDYICCLYATSPMVRPADLVCGLRLIEDFKAWHCVSVGTKPLRDAAQFYWSASKAVKEEGEYYDWTTVNCVVPENRICDINTPEDWARAEAMYAELHK
jgi:pseudaminic acid cytidylyltransferase